MTVSCLFPLNFFNAAVNLNPKNFMASAEANPIFIPTEKFLFQLKALDGRGSR
jgi:hypothetical protein